MITTPGFFDLEQILMLLEDITQAFSSIWNYITTPIEELLKQNGIAGILVELIVPDQIDSYSLIYFMCTFGIVSYLAFAFYKWLKDLGDLT